MSGEILPGQGFNTYEEQDKVLVGMSGGVDSSVVVRILQEQGFQVFGAVIRFSPEHESAVQAAQATAQSLGVPLHVIDAQADFEANVVEPFCRSYCKGITPNPCIFCNPLVKFQLLAEKADQLGIRFLATGHYARVELCQDGVCRIAPPLSAARDQTYMLYRLPREILDRLILPLGEFEKEDVRQIARDLELSCADAPDSMEICFIPDGDYVGYIRARGGQPKEGHFISPEGADLGPHQGVWHYTIGQRKGLGLALGQPVFVREIKENGDIQLAWAGQEYFTGLTLEEMTTPDGAPLAPGEYTVKIRSAAKPVPCLYEGDGKVSFPQPVRAPAPGQSAVFYKDGYVMGGGVIAEIF